MVAGEPALRLFVKSAEKAVIKITKTHHLGENGGERGGETERERIPRQSR